MSIEFRAGEHSWTTTSRFGKSSSTTSICAIAQAGTSPSRLLLRYGSASTPGCGGRVTRRQAQRRELPANFPPQFSDRRCYALTGTVPGKSGPADGTACSRHRRAIWRRRYAEVAEGRRRVSQRTGPKPWTRSSSLRGSSALCVLCVPSFKSKRYGPATIRCRTERP